MSNQAEKPSRFIWQKLDEIAKDIEGLRGGVELMTDEIVYRRPDIETFLYELSVLTEGLSEVELRVQKLEKYNSMVYWVARQLVTVIMVAVMIYLLFVRSGI